MSYQSLHYFGTLICPKCGEVGYEKWFLTSGVRRKTVHIIFQHRKGKKNSTCVIDKMSYDEYLQLRSVMPKGKKLPPLPYLRKCRICGFEAHNEKELELFEPNMRSKTGRSNRCLKCGNKRVKEAYKKDPTTAKEYQLKNRKLFFLHYFGVVVCPKCNQTGEKAWYLSINRKTHYKSIVETVRHRQTIRGVQISHSCYIRSKKVMPEEKWRKIEDPTIRRLYDKITEIEESFSFPNKHNKKRGEP